jgi:hypothetical protein
MVVYSDWTDLLNEQFVVYGRVLQFLLQIEVNKRNGFSGE